MKRNRVQYMCMSALFTALVFVVTAYLHIPVYNGYVHMGDGFLFLAACLLPMPYAIAVGAVGAMLADVLTGFAIWAPGSMVIKALISMLFTCKGKKILSLRNVGMLLPAALISIAGYYLYEALITGSFVVPLASVPGSVMQAVASSIVFAVMGFALDRLGVRTKLGQTT